MQENIGRKAMLISLLKEHGIEPGDVEEIYKIEMRVTKYFEYGGVVPDYFELQDIEKGEESKKVYWTSNSEESICPYCGEKSTTRANEYYHKEIQDIPVNGLAVFHVCRVNKYKCLNLGCEHKIFTERTTEFCIKDARKTERLKKYCILQAMQSNCHAAEQVLKLYGAQISNDSIARYSKVVAASIIEESLKKDNVEIISLDDINLRKGDKSSSCTVFIDQKTHRVLIIIHGANKEAVAQVLEKFTSTEIVSRDRACAYAAAATEAKKVQVADRFHLIKNAQDAVKNAVRSMMPTRIFVREGDGWVCADEQGANVSVSTDYYFCVPDEIVDQRVKLAKLTEKQEAKYRNTLKTLEMSGKGMRTADIAKRLGINMEDVRRYRRVAVETLKSVDKKIKTNIEIINSSRQEHFEMIATRDIKTIGPKAHSSRESIVEPFRDTVISMHKEGHTHRTIHPELVKLGFKGCPNAVYQYIAKLRKETMVEVKPNEVEEPPALNLKSVTHGTVYQSILKEASKERPKNREKNNSTELKKSDFENKPEKRDLSAPDDSPLSPEIRKIMYGKSESNEKANSTSKSAESEKEKEKEKEKENKKLEKKLIMDKVYVMFPMLLVLVQFMKDLYNVFDSSSIEALDAFIIKYTDSEIHELAQYVNGIQNDYTAVKNSLLYPDISNGPSEGINSRVKLKHRSSSGREGMELLNAYMIIPKELVNPYIRF